MAKTKTTALPAWWTIKAVPFEKRTPSQKGVADKSNRARHNAIRKMRITDEEKNRWHGCLVATWSAIAGDAMQGFDEMGRKAKVSDVIEMTLDADRPTAFSEMTREELDVVWALTRTGAGKKWIHGLMKGYV